MIEEENIINSVRSWVESFVIEYNLCPFAKRELFNNQIRFAITKADTEEKLLFALQAELEKLAQKLSIETTLLIHPYVLQKFYDYNEFLSVAEGLLTKLKLEGIYQIASFHPDYQFDGTNPDDAENFTNRSPYQMLHILREHSLKCAIDNYSDVENIPERNIKLMNSLGETKLKMIMQKFF